jgi:ABC-type branched-subunit amino acid transport system ATPase component
VTGHPNAASPLLELRKVSAGYGPVTVLDRLSLAVARREIVTLVGANGSGKSTALKTVIGLTRLTGGTVLLDGADITGLAAHRRAALGIGYVPQTENVFNDLTVADNLRMGAYLSPERLAAGTAEVLELFPRLAERRTKLAGSLSGGERRMLSIGLALLLRPRLLLLDEPSSDLAPALVDSVFEAIQRIHATLEIPILLVEQNVPRALVLADRVCVLVRGRLALDAPTVEVDREQLRRLFLQGDPARAQA